MSEMTLFEESAGEYVRKGMEEIRQVPWNGLTAVGSFSGCGGSSLGLKMAGWRIPAVIEFIPAAADTYEANFPDAHVFREDIRKITAEEILEEIGLQRGELDLFEGSPPCASFSAAGMRESGWGTEKKYSDSKQRTDDLFEEWTRLVDGLYPRAFVAENVPGMTSGAALEEYAHKTTAALSELGYRVDCRILNAANFGVPQQRKRLIFVGYRRDQEIEARLPDPTVSVPFTTRQAIESVDPEDPDHRPFLEDSSMVGKAVGRTWEWLTAIRDAKTEEERRAADALKDNCAECGEPIAEHRKGPKIVKAVKKKKGQEGVEREKEVIYCKNDEEGTEVKSYFLLTLPELDKPCPTLTATGAQSGAASVVHPTECRKFTPAEAKALGGFPPDFILTGSREQMYERIGRAVTPPMYEAVGTLLAERLNEATRELA